MYYQPYQHLKPEEVIVYLRKSRSDDPTLTVEEVLEKHETIIDEWCERNIQSKVPEENKYREVVSGETIDDRPEMLKLLKQVESPKYKAVLVVEVQRLSRGDLEDAGRLIKLLRYTNTLVITPQKTYDLRDDYDRDYFERELKRGNEFLEYQKKIMNRGRLLSVSQGNYIGSVAPYGYNKIWVDDGKRKCPTLAINEEQAEIVRLIFDLYVKEGYSAFKIAKHLDSIKVKPPKGEYWSPYALIDLLKNVHYIGKVKWNWRKTIKVVEDSEIRETRPKSKIGEYLLYDGKHDPIISEEIFDAAQKLKGDIPPVKSKTEVRNPFAGLVYCKCGKAMTYRTYLHPDGSVRSEPRLLCINQARCKISSCLYTEMEALISDILKNCIADFDVRIKSGAGDSAKLHDQLIKQLEHRKAELEAKEVSQWESQSHPDPSQRMPQAVFKQLNEKVLKEKEEVQQALCKAYESVPDVVDYQEQKKRFEDALNALHDPDVPAKTKNRLLKAVIERIDYDRGKAYRTRRAEPRKRITVDGKRKVVTDLPTGAHWTTSPIELDVKLKV